MWLLIPIVVLAVLMFLEEKLIDNTAVQIIAKVLIFPLLIVVFYGIVALFGTM